MTEREPLSAALQGCTIVIAVDRRSGELAAALERHGAQVRAAPALTIVPHIDDAALLERTRELIADPPDIVVVSTGIGFRGWIEAAIEADLVTGLTEALEGAQIVARGPKARGAIQQAGLTADWVAESETSAELGEYLVAQGIAGRRIAVQHHGSGADGLDELFAGHGADVVSMTVYRWGPPADPDAVRRSVAQTASGEVDAVLFTSAPGASQWLAEAERDGALDAIARRSQTGRLLVAAVGPITAGPLQDAGLRTTIAERGRLGSLVRCVVGYFGGGGAPIQETVGGRLELRSGGAVLDERFVPLSRSGVELLGMLFDAAGSVVPRERLQSSLSRSAPSTHAVEMAVARVREALGAPDVIKTVVKRGYRLNVRGDG
ncbi:uroporphyrinogen-III synthase [Microbacterium saccharophilum]|uniref:Uroporphyrinogen-III synthase n=1 Tax=Microbacterium saccharophilum TaxID=1213358 RepID=A0A5C8I8X2_9MICO|nr:uroporphyrinogen-III synthase [Microbacterium saccharophilum]TXK14353.1 uroporphyrinogen-III synthase [Microbacterium saccharophilum]GEP49050.1 putative transcriptional regulatory protein [Microbacterium saccharophilum]